MTPHHFCFITLYCSPLSLVCCFFLRDFQFISSFVLFVATSLYFKMILSFLHTRVLLFHSLLTQPMITCRQLSPLLMKLGYGTSTSSSCCNIGTFQTKHLYNFCQGLTHPTASISVQTSGIAM